MKSIHFFSFVTVLSLICFSCSNQQKSPVDAEILSIDKAVVLNIEPATDTIYLSTLVKSMDVVPLESRTDALIGSISSIQYDDSLFFCLDYKEKKIYSFDINGLFRGLVGHNGRGPGEYSRPLSIGVDSYNKQLLVLDNGHSIKMYDYNGSFISTADFDLKADEFVMTKNSICFFTSKTVNFKPDYNDYWGAELTTVNRKNYKSIDRYIPVNKELFPVDGSHTTLDEKMPFSPLLDSYSFHYNFTNYIYSISKKNSDVSVKYVVDFGKNAFKDDLAEMSTIDALKYMDSNPKRLGFLHNVIETDSLLIFSYYSNNSNNNIFINYKNSHTSISGPFVNDIFEYPYKIRGVIDSNTFFCVVDDPTSLKFFENCVVSVNGKEKLVNATSSENPIIIICHY